MADIDFAAMPKVELHRHLEGSVRVETILDIAKETGHEWANETVDSLRGKATMQGQAPSFGELIYRFELLRGLYPGEAAIKRVVREAVEDAQKDGVIYLELRYNPAHFTQGRDFTIEDVAEWVTDARNEAVGEYNIQVELLATINRGKPVEESLPVIELATEGAGTKFIGIDVAGDETKGSIARFAGVLREARRNGLGVTVHAGEAGPPSNVREAIQLLSADRIGHGINVTQDPSVAGLARQQGVVFEVAPTSNIITGGVKTLKEHPMMTMGMMGLAVCINTDDPVTCGTTLTREYQLCNEELGLGKEDFLNLNVTAIGGSFLPEEDKENLRAMFEEEFSKI